jgi:hypothetical protein
MKYPLYWNQTSDGDVAWLRTGGLAVEANLIAKNNVVEFVFYDSGNKYVCRREFPSPNGAKNFAIKFGRIMKQLDRQSSVPLPKTFEEFK